MSPEAENDAKKQRCTIRKSLPITTVKGIPGMYPSGFVVTVEPVTIRGEFCFVELPLFSGE
ncbi:MAG: hypothetical protein RID21_26550 [Gimesia sp.]